MLQHAGLESLIVEGHQGFLPVLAGFLSNWFRSCFLRQQESQGCRWLLGTGVPAAKLSQRSSPPKHTAIFLEVLFQW